MTIVVIIEDKKNKKFYSMDLVSGTFLINKTMTRKSPHSNKWRMKLYKKDKQGYYYIPEVESQLCTQK